MTHPGSGPSDRYNDVLFPPIRAALLTTGVAVCSYDKRGVGGSEGHWEQAGIEDQADDLAAGLRAAREIVADGPGGLFGHSQGGWVVLEASRQIRPTFVITNSGPSVSPAVQEEFSTGNRLREIGRSDADVAAGVMLFNEVMQRATAGESFTQAQRWMAEPERVAAIRELVEVDAFVPESEHVWSLAGSLGRFDPQPAIESLTVPLLALFGALDPVVPVDECVARLRQWVRPSLLEVVVVADGNHRIQLDRGESFAPGYLAALTTFVAAQLEQYGHGLP
jgi:hypothetical protein